MSLSFRAWSSPITWPGNFELGPQTRALLTDLDKPFSIFSTASLKVEFFFRIIGSLDGSFFGSFV